MLPDVNKKEESSYNFQLQINHIAVDMSKELFWLLFCAQRDISPKSENSVII